MTPEGPLPRALFVWNVLSVPASIVYWLVTGTNPLALVGL